MLAAFTYSFSGSARCLARGFRRWRKAAMGSVAVTISVMAMMVPIMVSEGLLATQATASAQAHVATLGPAPGQPDPTSLWRSKPIPAVAAAARAARRHAPLPQTISPSLAELTQENATGDGIVPAACQPAFGSGVTGQVCRLGDRSATRVVVVLGDSHAGAWMPAVAAAALAQHFAVVPLDKPGCFVNRLNTDLPGWPCASWYHWALAQDRALHPVATIVTFLLSPYFQQRPASTVSDMKSVLSQVTNGVFLSDPPEQDQKATECISAPGANMGRCAARVPSTFIPLMRALARMTTMTHHPAIPTLQWFCAGGICPMVIDNTLTTRDASHMTKEYSTALGPLLSLELKPILARLERRRPRTLRDVRRARTDG